MMQIMESEHICNHCCRWRVICQIITEYFQAYGDTFMFYLILLHIHRTLWISNTENQIYLFEGYMQMQIWYDFQLIAFIWRKEMRWISSESGLRTVLGAGAGGKG